MEPATPENWAMRRNTAGAKKAHDARVLHRRIWRLEAEHVGLVLDAMIGSGQMHDGPRQDALARTCRRRIGHSQAAPIAIALFALLLRMPLINKPLQHDERYNAFPYLATGPLSSLLRQPAPAAGVATSGWAADWKRQIAVHPPLVAAFYFAWIRGFGDSPVSLHAPTIVLGCISVGLLCVLASRIEGAREGRIAALAMACSLAHVEHSVQAVHAIFELSVFVASLLVLSELLWTTERRWLWALLALDVVGIATFYHFFIFLTIQAAILWFARRRLRVPPAYFVAVMLAWVGMWSLFLFSLQHAAFHYPFWPVWNLRTVGLTLSMLPWLFTPTHPYPNPPLPALEELGRGFYGLLACAFLVGCGLAMIAWIRTRGHRDLMRAAVAAAAIVPLIVYLALDAIGLRQFGEPRNFFYLEPAFFLLVFHALRRLRLRPAVVCTLSGIIITLLVATGVNRGFTYWRQAYAERGLTTPLEQSAPVGGIREAPGPRSRFPGR